MKISQFSVADYNLFKKNLFKRNTANQCPTCRKGAPLRELKKDAVQISFK